MPSQFPDVVEKLIKIFGQHGRGLRDVQLLLNDICPAGWSHLSSESIIEAMNKHLRVKLGLLTADTFDARECLIQEDSVGDWVYGFKTYVMPALVKHELV